MTTAEIATLAREVYRAGFWFVERDERHTPEMCAELERVLNKLFKKFGRRCAVRLDGLGMTITVERA